MSFRHFLNVFLSTKMIQKLNSECFKALLKLKNMECQDDNLIIGQNNNETLRGLLRTSYQTLYKNFTDTERCIVKYILSTFLENCRPDFD